MTENDPAVQEKNTPDSKRPPAHLDVQFLFQHPAHIVALGLGSGLSPVAPGTAGTLFAWASYVLLSRFLNAPVLGLVVVLSFPLGLWACKITAEHLRVKDPGAIVWDEVVAFWAVLWVMSILPGVISPWIMQLIAFGLFRLFDAVKRGPVGWADRKFTGGGYRGAFGIMFDDLVAAALTLICMLAIHFGQAYFLIQNISLH